MIEDCLLKVGQLCKTLQEHCDTHKCSPLTLWELNKTLKCLDLRHNLSTEKLPL